MPAVPMTYKNEHYSHLRIVVVNLSERQNFNRISVFRILKMRTMCHRLYRRPHTTDRSVMPCLRSNYNELCMISDHCLRKIRETAQVLPDHLKAQIKKHTVYGHKNAKHSSSLLRPAVRKIQTYGGSMG